ncbi:MAG: hypothetical protein AAF433_08770 [Bacteroidota bacterium]
MNRLFLFAACLLLSLLVYTCGSTNTQQFEGPFFDLAGYMQQEIESLQQEEVELEKTITLNGETETQRISDINYEQELLLFRNADINKPAWIEKYELSTEELPEEQIRMTYTATDSTLMTQLLVVIQQDEEVAAIRIIRKTGSVLSKGRQELIYLPRELYSIEAKQEGRVGGHLNSLIEGRFLP